MAIGLRQIAHSAVGFGIIVASHGERFAFRRAASRRAPAGGGRHDRSTAHERERRAALRSPPPARYGQSRGSRVRWPWMTRLGARSEAADRAWGSLPPVAEAIKSYAGDSALCGRRLATSVVTLAAHVHRVRNPSAAGRAAQRRRDSTALAGDERHVICDVLGQDDRRPAEGNVGPGSRAVVLMYRRHGAISGAERRGEREPMGAADENVAEV